MLVWWLYLYSVPVSRENAERRRLVAGVVHVLHRVGRAALGHHLLVLDCRAFKCLAHVDVLQRDWKALE